MAKEKFDRSKWVGKQGFYVAHAKAGGDSMSVAIEVEDAKVSFGFVHVRITPVAGYGMIWVRANSVKWGAHDAVL